MDLFPTPVSEYTKQRISTSRFTVRSANSPSYSLTRRPLVSQARALSEDVREGAEEYEGRRTYQKYADSNGANRENPGYQAWTWSRGSVKRWYEEMGNKSSNSLIQDGTTDFGINRGQNPTCGSRGRSDWRSYNLSSRSKSSDWKARTGSPDRSTRPSNALSNEHGGKPRGGEGIRGQMMSSVAGSNYVFQDRSPTSPQTLERVNWGYSLPYRRKSQTSSDFRGSTSSLEHKGGQSIMERIEKLYGSTGFAKTEDYSRIRDSPERDWCEGKTGNVTLCHKGSTSNLFTPPEQRSWDRASGGTFPRRYSLVEKRSPMQSWKPFTWAPQKDTTTLDSDTSRTCRRTPEVHWQDHFHGRYSEGSGEHLGRGFLTTGTMSLDRARSRNSVAAKIRSARLALLEKNALNSIGVGERRACGGQGATNQGEESGGTAEINGMWRERTVQEKERGETPIRGTCLDEDVFESNPWDIRVRTVGKKASSVKLDVLSAASVRNKISQFEALTQRAQGLASGQVQIPRRAFSVPTQLHSPHSGVKKSGSAKALSGLREKWDSLGEEGEAAKKVEEKGCRPGEQGGQSERASSVDEGGLRLENKNIESGKTCTDVFGEYSRLKHSLEIPLNGGAQKCQGKFYIDETDFSKVSSPEEASKDVNASKSSILSNSGDTGSPQYAEKKTTPPRVLSPHDDDDDVGDHDDDDDENDYNDKTPINSPNQSPLHSPVSLPENTTSSAENENASITQTAKIPEQDHLRPGPPLATSSHSNLPDLISPKANFLNEKKQVLDLDAWVAGWKVWKDNEDPFEDDDDDDSTQKDDDSKYDSDSGKSSVTITSYMSQAENKSFCVSLSDLCNFAADDYESENDSDEWQLAGRRSASLSSDVSALSHVSVLPTEELDKLMEDVRGLGDSARQDDVQVVVLHKEMGVGLGFSMAGGMDQSKPVTVHKVFPTGVAAQEGSIREGDQVLSINGSVLQGHTHWEALRILRRAKTREMGVVVLRRGGDSSSLKDVIKTHAQVPTQTQTTEKGRCVCVRLEKNSRDLGFSLEGGAGLGNRPLTVQKIFQGGPVDKVCPGDEVVEIEGVSMVGMRRLEAWTLIRRLPSGPVDVVLCRPQKTLEQ
ncbi:uncharacterized protein ACBR49_005325 [Aulostomus maculatus]